MSWVLLGAAVSLSGLGSQVLGAVVSLSGLVPRGGGGHPPDPPGESHRVIPQDPPGESLREIAQGDPPAGSTRGISQGKPIKKSQLRSLPSAKPSTCGTFQWRNPGLVEGVQ
jgi:hypothetical protein